MILIIELAAILGFWQFSKDDTLSYVQSSKALTIDIFVKAPKELEIGPELHFYLLEPFCGLSESGDYRWRTLRFDLIEIFGMKKQLWLCFVLQTLFRQNFRTLRKLRRLNSRSWSSQFWETYRENNWKISKHKKSSTGIENDKVDDWLVAHHKRLMGKIKHNSIGSEVSEFRSIRAKLF